MNNVVRFILFGLCYVVAISMPSAARQWEVRQSGQTTSIGHALTLAGSGDTIVIQSGTYFESGINITKPITLLGVGLPVVDGQQRGEIFTITAPDVTIKGLSIIGSQVSFTRENAGIYLDSADHCNLIGNHLENDFFGIYLANCRECMIHDNVIIGSATSLALAGNGIHLWKCHNIDIQGNTVSGHRDGIYFEFVTHCAILNNQSTSNLRYGLHFMFSDSCTYQGNLFERNGAGVAVMYTHHILMAQNSFSDNRGNASYGLLLKDIKDSEVRGNKFIRNSIGVYLEGTDRVVIAKNEFTENGYAIKIMADAIDNKITSNSFIANSFQVATNSTQSNSVFSGNYWSTYQGYDLNKDGIGDVPFRPVTLYTLVVESHPETLILLQSLLIHIIDLAEELVPTLTPQALVDNKPLMRPIL